MKFNKILVVGIGESALGQSYWTKLKSLGGQFVMLPKDSEKLSQELRDTDCLLVNFGIEINKSHVDSAPSLKYIGIMATAFAKVDVVYAQEKGVVVTHLPGYSTESVAEFTIAVILEQLRQLEEGKARGRSANYSEVGIKAREIKGKIFGVIGLGHIGSCVAEIAQGFGAEVHYWSHHRKTEQETSDLVFEEIDTLTKSADFLSLNLAQTPETENFLNAERLNTLKPGCVVVNTAPMELVDINALADRLAQNDITFILDHSDEMSEADLAKLSAHPNCIIYPPIAYVSEEARMAKQDMFTGNAEKFLAGSPENIAG